MPPTSRYKFKFLSVDNAIREQLESTGDVSRRKMSDIQFPSSFNELSSAADGELRVEEVWEVDTLPGDLGERIEGNTLVFV